MSDLDDKALAALDAALTLPAPPPAIALTEPVDDYGRLTLERKDGLWRLRWETSAGERETDWRRREKIYTQVALYIGFLKTFLMAGLGRVPMNVAHNAPPDITT